MNGGDYHIQLKLDPGQPRFLNTKNMTKQKGCLVMEPICIKPVTQEDAKKSLQESSETNNPK